MNTVFLSAALPQWRALPPPCALSFRLVLLVPARVFLNTTQVARMPLTFCFLLSLFFFECQ